MKAMMWSKKNKTIITTESREIVIVRKIKKNNAIGFCNECGGEVSFLTLDEAVAVSGRNAKVILREMDARNLHTSETPSGQLLFCDKSLAERNK